MTTSDQSMASLVPQAWKDGGVESVWISAHRVAASQRTHEALSLLSVPPARVAFIPGSITYQSLEMTGSILTGDLQLSASTQTSATGLYCVVIAPFSGDEPATREVLTETVGLIAAVCGAGVAFEKVYDNVLNIRTGELSGFGPVMQSPNAYGPTRDTTADLNLLERVAARLESMPPADATRIRQGLHWFALAGDDHGQDELIKLWVALEALAMPGTTIRPVNDLLASAYGITHEVARDRFGVGKIQGFRSRILHNGERLPVHADLSGFLRSLLTDVLFELVGEPSARLAESYIAQPLWQAPFDLDALLHI